MAAEPVRLTTDVITDTTQLPAVDIKTIQEVSPKQLLELALHHIEKQPGEQTLYGKEIVHINKALETLDDSNTTLEFPAVHGRVQVLITSDPGEDSDDPIAFCLVVAAMRGANVIIVLSGGTLSSDERLAILNDLFGQSFAFNTPTRYGHCESLLFVSDDDIRSGAAGVPAFGVAHMFLNCGPTSKRTLELIQEALLTPDRTPLNQRVVEVVGGTTRSDGKVMVAGGINQNL